MNNKFFLQKIIIFSVLLPGIAFSGVLNSLYSPPGTYINKQADNNKCENGILLDDISIYVVKPIADKLILSDTPRSELKSTGCSIEVVAAKNEYEPASFVIRSNLDIVDDVNIVALTLENKNNFFSKKNIEIKMVKIWYQGGDAWKEIGITNRNKNRVKLVPELLLNDENLIKVDENDRVNYLKVDMGGKEKYLWKGSKIKNKKSIINLSPDYYLSDAKSLQVISVKKNRNKQIWMTFHVPVDAQAGIYKGYVKLKYNGNKVVNIPVKLKVLPYELAAPRLEYGIYYHGRIHESEKESISSEYKSIKQLRAELLDMFQHGFKNPIIYQHHIINRKFLKEYLLARNEIGMDNSKLYFMWLNTKNIETETQIATLKKQIADLQIFLKEFGTKEIYVYGIDEAVGPDLIKQKKAWDSIREIGVKVYAAGYEGTYEATGESLDLFVFARSPMIKEAEKYHSINHKIFSYANPQSGVENPYLYRRNYGLVLWASGFDGAMVYAYQHSMGDAWNDSDHFRYRDHNFTYPTSNGVVKTIAWEGMREAIDDVGYFSTLENLIKNYHENKNKKVSELVKKSENYLNAIKKEANKHNNYGRYTSDFYIDLYEVRKKVINYISEFNKYE